MKKKFILLPITLATLTPMVSMVGCGEKKPTPTTSFNWSINADGSATLTGFIGDETEVIIPTNYIDKEGTHIVKNIGDSAFLQSNILKIVIPNTIESIGKRAFDNCAALKELTIGAGVESIVNDSFFECSELESIKVDKDNKKYWSKDEEGEHNCVVENSGSGKNLIVGCKNTLIPNDVTSIGSNAFDSCTGLTEVKIPDSVTSIGENAFSWCPALKALTIGAGVKSICEYAFAWCEKLTKVKIPNSVAEIRQSAFFGCTGLINLTIGKSVKTIGDSAFQDCTAITSIIFNGTSEEYKKIVRGDCWHNDVPVEQVYCAEDKTSVGIDD